MEQDIASSSPSSVVDSPSSIPASLGWATFLGASWTWCIGMFLPVLLVRDYGFWGWVVFAIPNVIGAAAMGWVLRSVQISREIVESHRRACKLFSAVTIAFHLFFVVGVVAPLAASALAREHDRDLPMDLSLGLLLGAGAAMYLYMTRRRDGELPLAILTMAISLAAMAFATIEIHQIAVSYPEKMPPISTAWHPALPWLAASCIVGFFACPYLDLTFHRARQRTPTPRISFSIGFGVLFFLMIVFSLVYSRAFTLGVVTPYVAILLFTHMAVQCAFTVAAHAREIGSDDDYAIVVAAGLTLASWAVYWILPNGRLAHNLNAGEIIYRVFMGFYGLAFPAYLWLVMLPGRGVSVCRRNLMVFVVATALAAPMFWMAFVMGRMFYIAPALAIVLLSRFFTRGGGREYATSRVF